MKKFLRYSLRAVTCLLLVTCLVLFGLSLISPKLVMGYRFKGVHKYSTNPQSTTYIIDERLGWTVSVNKGNFMIDWHIDTHGVDLAPTPPPVAVYSDPVERSWFFYRVPPRSTSKNTPRQTDLRFLGFQWYTYRQTYDPVKLGSPPQIQNSYGITLPLWPFIVACALPVFFWVKAYLRRRRYAEDQCQTCGYSLRGLLSDRCPECGTRISRVTPPQNIFDRM